MKYYLIFSISLFELFGLERSVYPEHSRHRQDHKAARLAEGEPDARSQDVSRLTKLHL